MTREEFLGVFLGFAIKKSDQWLPEEAPEEDLLNIMQKRLSEHSHEIKLILERVSNNNE